MVEVSYEKHPFSSGNPGRHCSLWPYPAFLFYQGVSIGGSLAALYVDGAARAVTLVLVISSLVF